MNFATDTHDEKPAFVPERELKAALSEARVAARQRDELVAENARLRSATEDFKGPDAQSRRATILRDALARKEVEILVLKDHAFARERALRESHDTIEGLQREMEGVEERVRAASGADAIARLEYEQARLANERDGYVRERDALAWKLRELEPTLAYHEGLVAREAEARAQLADAEATIEAVSGRLDSTRENYAIAKRAAEDDHAEEIAAVREALHAAEVNAQAAEAKCATLYQSLESERAARANEVAEIRAELASLLEAAKAGSETERAELTRSCDHAYAELATVAEALVKAEASLAQAQSEAAEAKEHLAEKVTAARADAEATIARLGAEALAARADTDATIARFESDLAAARAEREAASTQAECNLAAARAETDLVRARAEVAAATIQAEMDALRESADADAAEARETLDRVMADAVGAAERGDESEQRIHDAYNAEMATLRETHTAEITAMEEAHARETAVLRESVDTYAARADWADARTQRLTRAVEDSAEEGRTLAEDVEAARLALTEQAHRSAVRLAAMERALAETAAFRDRYARKLAGAMEQVRAARRETSLSAEALAKEARTLSSLVGKLTARWVLDGARVAALQAGRLRPDASDVDEALSWVAEEVPETVAEELWAAREALIAQCLGSAS